MEPAKNNTNNLVNHDDDEVLDDHLEKIVQDFNEFKSMFGASCGDAMTMTPDDLIDMYITTGGVGSPVDFNGSESTLPQHQMQSAYVESTDNFNINIEFLLTDEMTQNMNQIDTGKFPNSSPIENTMGAEGSSSRVTHIRYGDIKCHGVAEHICSSAETVFHSVMKSFSIPGKGRKNLLQKARVKEKRKGTTTRKYIKKRYLQIETNEDIARHMETANAKNREAGAKARARKQGLRSIYMEPTVRVSPEE